MMIGDFRIVMISSSHLRLCLTILDTAWNRVIWYNDMFYHITKERPIPCAVMN
jgi:hypothetical protein